jgi:hypothetical protein
MKSNIRSLTSPLIDRPAAVRRKELGKNREYKTVPYGFAFFYSVHRFPLMESGFSLIRLKKESPLENLGSRYTALHSPAAMPTHKGVVCPPRFSYSHHAFRTSHHGCRKVTTTTKVP